MRLFWLSCFFIIFQISLASAASQTTHPLYPELPPSFLSPIRRVVLDNGLVTLVKDSARGSNIAVSILVRVGQEVEGLESLGMRYFLSRLILTTPVSSAVPKEMLEKIRLINQKSTDLSLEEVIENFGGVLDVITTADYVEFSLVVPKKWFNNSLILLSNAIFSPDFSPLAVENVRKEVLEHLQTSQREAYSALYDIFLKQFYTYHPYRLSLFGSQASINRITPESLRQFHSMAYTPLNSILSIVGHIDVEDGVNEVRDIFQKYKTGQRIFSPIYYEPKLEESKTLYYQGDGGVSWIFLGYSAPPVKSKDYEAMQIINQLLGTGLSSRIWMELREKRGLAYQLGSNFPGRHNSSHFILYVVTNRASLEESNKLLLKEIARIKDLLLTEEELSTVKRMLVGRFLLDIESSKAKASFIAWSEAFGKGILYERSYLENILSLTSVQIQEVARKYLRKYVLIVAE